MKKENERNKKEGLPKVYCVKKDDLDFSFSRRDFLVTAATGSAAAVLGSRKVVNNDKNTPDRKNIPVERNMVFLEIDALGMLVSALATGIQRIWRISNTGDNYCPEGVIELTAEHDSEFKLEIPVPPITPGNHVEVPLNFTTPNNPGEFRYMWQLKIENNTSKPKTIYIHLPDDTLAKSLHPYLPDTDEIWTINNPDPLAKATRIHFSRLEVENIFDHIFIKDSADNVIQTLTGSYPTGLWSEKVNGNEIKVHLISDADNGMWGFHVDEVQASFETYLPLVLNSDTPCNCDCVSHCSCDCVSHCSCDCVCVCTCTCTSNYHYWYPN